MKPTLLPFAHTTISGTSFEVSTTRVRLGRRVWFITAVILGGQASDGERSANAAEAIATHQGVCKAVREVAGVPATT